MAPVPTIGVHVFPETSVEIYKLTAEASVPLLVPPASQRPADEALASNWFQAHVFRLSDASVEETTVLVQDMPFVLYSAVRVGVAALPTPTAIQFCVCGENLIALICSKSMIPFPLLAMLLVPNVQPVAPDGSMVYAMEARPPTPPVF